MSKRCAVLALVFALAVSASACSGGRDEEGASIAGDKATPASEDGSAGMPVPSGGEGEGAEPAPVASTVPAVGPRVIQTASLTVSVARGKFDETVDLEARVRHLRAVETQLLELLERADTVAAALAVQSQLNQVQLELEQARGRLQYLTTR
jgi:hypothetical protein